MMLGEVTTNREAVIRLPLRAPDGQAIEVEAVIDTGFTDYLTLPLDPVSILQLPFRETSEFILADGNTVELDVYRAEVLWDGHWRGVLVTAAKGGALAGMSLLYGSRLTLDIIDGGRLSIEALL